MGDYKHGEMDVAAQENTFAGFIKAGVWISVVVTLILIFLALVAV